MRTILLLAILNLSACAYPWFQHDCSQREWLGNPNCK